ncbi:MAG TPA: DUF2934 domain-containing protein [Methylomirabilota bacterium]|nr:DUF2934 domain-containing protein [Methylomirabilota bacterium]
MVIHRERRKRMATRISESNGTGVASQETIARRAYEIWEGEGRPEGRAMEHWLRAASELKAQSDGVESVTLAPKEPKEQRTVRRAAPRPVENRFQTTR